MRVMKLEKELKIPLLDLLAGRLAKKTTPEEKLGALKDYLKAAPDWVKNLLPELSEREQIALLELFATGQAGRFITFPIDLPKLKNLLSILSKVEDFYAPIGGVLGYHQTVLKLLSKSQRKKNRGMKFHAPPVIDISDSADEDVQSAVQSGIAHLEEVAEIYTVGGAADRLGLQDEKNGDFLPAAVLKFCGKTLLEYLIEDLQAREYLHFMQFGKQVSTPIAMMTSPEKDNHARILAICEEKGWFGRSKENFRLFIQPLVPTLNKQGEWGNLGPYQLLLKPGGHGVIWKLAEQAGIFDWFFSLGCKKALVRQINNVIAGVDQGLLAFTGIGCKNDMRMGFASCSRLVRTSEGINVLVERRGSYCLTNIEYCDLDQYGLQDEPMSPWNPYSKYPANTNILFVDLKEVREVVKSHPLPGMLVNAKKMKVQRMDGTLEEEELLRLESTMQNIADYFVEKELPRRSFLTYNLRHKTISSIKRAYSGAGLAETPEGCLYDLLKNARELLVQHCQFVLPEMPEQEEFLKGGPTFIFLYHPALGPLYSIIEKKIQGGRLGLGSELQLEIADFCAENLEVEGSLIIRTEAVMGHRDERGILHYSDKRAKCRLKNVRVKNKGISPSTRSATHVWKSECERIECCEIILEEGAEFEAENLTLTGNQRILVTKK